MCVYRCNYLNSRNQVQYVDRHSSHPPMSDGPYPLPVSCSSAKRLRERAVYMVPSKPRPLRALPAEPFWLNQLFGPIDPWLAILWLCGISHTQKNQAALSHTPNEEVHLNIKKKSELGDVRGWPEDVCVFLGFWGHNCWKM